MTDDLGSGNDPRSNSFSFLARIILWFSQKTLSIWSALVFTSRYFVNVTTNGSNVHKKGRIISHPASLFNN